MSFWYYIFIILFSVTTTAQKKIHHLPKLSTEFDFEKIKGSPATNKFSEIDAVKVVYDIKNDSLYFINANLYDYHFSFCVRYLGYKGNKKMFDNNNYNSVKNRDYLMGTINRFYNHNLFTLEFSVADNITIDQIRFLYTKIIEKFDLSGLFKLFINTNNMRGKCQSILDIPTIDADEIYKGQIFQSLHQNFTYGILKFIDVDSLKSYPNLTKKDIVVLNKNLDILPPVSGLITADFQTPLSHLTILCQNRDTPMMAFKNVWHDSLFRSYENKPIFFKISEDTFILEEVNKDEVYNYWTEKEKNIKTIKLPVNTNFKSIIPINYINNNSVSYAGSKASNFGYLSHLKNELKLKVKIPENAFVIPFYFYEKHIELHEIKTLIDELLLNKKKYIEQGIIQKYLENIRVRIISSDIDSILIRDVINQVKQSHFHNIRFRSSTNAEDLEGFNGAGLYDSKTGFLDNTDKSFELAIKKVWASTWNYRAFMEREYFGIDQNTVSMGILCHRSFPNEVANGVVITKNLYRNNSRGFVINTQYGETSVVNPPTGVNCDQLICYSDIRYKNDSFYGKKNIIEYISYSNILPDSIQTVLNSSEVNKITRETAKIKKKLYHAFLKKNKGLNYHDFALDIEFKIYDEERSIYFKQIRPFKN